jgi:ATP-binding cassette subfamily B protein RaxB
VRARLPGDGGVRRHGHRTDLPTLRRRFSLSARASRSATWCAWPTRCELHTRALRAELDDLPQLQTPCILHWDLNHFVVLVSLRRGVA